MAVLTFEALAIGYFTALAAAAPLTRASRRHAWRAALRSLALAVIILLGTRTLGADVRVWLGHAYLAFGYWLPAMLASGRHPGRFEAWLVRTDHAWRRVDLTPSPWIVHSLELSYLLCYPLVPAAFLVTWTDGGLSDLDRFWTAVLAAGFACYGTLPWLITRPPRVLKGAPPVRLPASARQQASSGEASPTLAPDPAAREGGKPDTALWTRLRDVNVFVLRHVSHGLNTFPSGHVAVAVAAAVMVLPVSWVAGTVLCAVAAAIAAGAVAGRYHYVVDVVWGIAVGGAAALVV